MTAHTAADTAHLSSRMPPQSNEVERGVLGAMIRDNDAIDDVLDVLAAEDFYLDAHRKIAAVVFDLHRDGKPADTVVLFEELRRRKQLDDVGGAEYLADLWDAVPTAANAVYYAGIVREKAKARAIIHAGTVAARDAHDSTDSADEIAARLEREVADATGDRRGRPRSPRG